MIRPLLVLRVPSGTRSTHMAGRSREVDVNARIAGAVRDSFVPFDGGLPLRARCLLGVSIDLELGGSVASRRLGLSGYVLLGRISA
jgi:hypothetical protein